MIPAVVRYGLHEPSGSRNSSRPYGILTIAVRLLSPYVMYAGAQVAPESDLPTTRRLYELTDGAASAVSPRACSRIPARKWYPTFDSPIPLLSLSS